MLNTFVEPQIAIVYNGILIVIQVITGINIQFVGE